MRCLFAVLLLAVALGWSGSAGAIDRSLPVRGARPADDVRRSADGWAEEWRVLAFDPATHEYATVSLVGGPIPELFVQARKGGETVSAGVELPYGLLPHEGPGVTVANLPDSAPPQKNSLSYVGGRYVVDLTWPAQGHLAIVPQRAGVTVGPWHLGGEPIVKGGPPTFVPGWMSWSVPVAVGTVSGWLAADGHRIEFQGWRAYHDHTWGRFKRSSSSWTHWDFAVSSPRAGEAWILNGLEPTDGRYWTLPHDGRWQGVLLHATPRGVSTCRAHVRRQGWGPRPLNLTGASFDYWLPMSVRASCGRTALSVRPAARPWPFFGGFNGGVLASSPLPAGNGWIDHAVPIWPTV